METSTWLQRLGRCTGNHLESTIAVAEGLVIEIPEKAQKLEQAIANENPTEIQRLAHTLKSCLNYVSDGPEISLASSIEEAGKDAKFAEASNALEDLTPHLQPWVDRIESWLDQQQAK